MKYIRSASVIIGVFALCSLWATNVFATPQLTAKVNGITLTAVLSEVNPAFNDVKLYYQTTPFSGSTLPTQNVVLPNSFDIVATFTKDLAPNTTYYLKVVGKVSGSDFTSPSVEVTTGDTLQVDKLSYETPSSDCKSIYINGRVLNPGRATYEVYLEYLNREEIQAGVNTWHKEYASKGRGAGASYGINDDGTYSFYLSNLTPNTKYTVKETVKSPGGGSYTEQGEFFSCKGNIAGTEEAVSDFNKRSYTFLSLDNAAAKVLGFRSNIIPDYDLCVEQAGADTEQQKACRNQIGDFINIIIKILISAAAIILVLQIILKGYQYMISDIPKFKINAKERLIEAFLGLLLALSAYLILNTINPRLVSGVLNVNNVDIGVDEEVEDQPQTEYNIGDDSKGCPEGFTDVLVAGTATKINVCKSISVKLEQMLTAAKADGVLLTGSGSRSTKRQKELRIAHGCADDNLPSSRCEPPTARPGRSMHERGKAVDFGGLIPKCPTKVNGACAAPGNKYWEWLNTHAKDYGFYQLKSPRGGEAWHWSTNGK